ncbi:hypothetical protein ES703_52751 [subsurface metagenome]
MLSEILLRLVAVMTVEDVRECKRLGLEAEVGEILDLWDGIVDRWAQADASHPGCYGSSSSVRLVLNGLRAALRG